jgi:hypothetical protein
MASLTYSFKDVQCAITGPGGVITLSNGAADEGISIESSADIDTMVIGADGTGMHSLSADKSGHVTVRLLKTSPTNALLSLMYAFQTSSAAQHGQNTIALVDSNRGDVVTCKQVAFAKAPPLMYGKDAGTNEWHFNAVQIDRTLGGL